MFLSNPFPGAFGLDIGDLSIKLMQLTTRLPKHGQSNFGIQELRSISLPPGLIVNGEIQQPEIIRKKILLLLGKEEKTYKPIHSRWVVADLPEPKTFLKLITIETPPKELLPEDIVYHAKNHLPFDLEDTYLDWHITPTTTASGHESQVLLAAVPKVIADSYTYLLEAAGLNPIALEVEAFSIARAMITATKNYTGEGRVILDIGATRSSLVVYDHGSIQFSTSIHFSGELLTTALSQGLKISHEEAEKLKVEAGAVPLKQHPKYLKIVDQLISMLVAEIRRALDFYQDHFSNTNPVTHITLCGGLARYKNLDSIITHKLGITAAPGNAWKNVLSRPVTEQEKSDGLALPSVIGLAIRATQNPLKE